MAIKNKSKKTTTSGMTVVSELWRRSKLFILFGVLLCGVVMSISYGLSNMNDNSIREPAIAAADQWLKDADRQKFDVCKEMVTDANGWFEYFKKDRVALGELNRRNFKIKSEFAVDNGNGYMLQYETFFNKDKKSPPYAEKVYLNRDRKGKYTVTGVEYCWPRGVWVWNGTPYEGTDLEVIKQKANVCALSYDSVNTAYFENIARQDPGNLQNRGFSQIIYRERQKRGRPVERQTVSVLLGSKVPGLSAMDYVAVVNKTTYLIKNKKQDVKEYVMLRKDNLAEKPEWEVYYFS
ncbi:MAG: hypothetical protein ACYC4Q_10160, partial [Victivallaceae bacterium]